MFFFVHSFFRASSSSYFFTSTPFFVILIFYLVVDACILLLFYTSIDFYIKYIFHNNNNNMRAHIFARVRKTYFRYCFNCRKEVAARIYYLVQWNLNGTLMSSMAKRTPHFSLSLFSLRLSLSRSNMVNTVLRCWKPPKNTISRWWCWYFSPARTTSLTVRSFVCIVRWMWLALARLRCFDWSRFSNAILKCCVCKLPRVRSNTSTLAVCLDNSDSVTRQIRTHSHRIG